MPVQRVLESRWGCVQKQPELCVRIIREPKEAVLINVFLNICELCTRSSCQSVTVITTFRDGIDSPEVGVWIDGFVVNLAVYCPSLFLHLLVRLKSNRPFCPSFPIDLRPEVLLVFVPDSVCDTWGSWQHPRFLTVPKISDYVHDIWQNPTYLDSQYVWPFNRRLTKP